MWLNLYGCHITYMVVRLSDVKTQKMHFYPFFELRTALQPFKLSHIALLGI
jgi:hypothetical protein